MQNSSTCLQSLLSVFVYRQARKTTSFKKTQKKKKLNLSLNSQSKKTISKKLTLTRSFRETVSPTTQLPKSVSNTREHQKPHNSSETRRNKGLNFHPRKISFNNDRSNKLISQQIVSHPRTVQIPPKRISEYLKIQPRKKQKQLSVQRISEKKVPVIEEKLKKHQQQKSPLKKSQDILERIDRIIQNSKRINSPQLIPQIEENKKEQKLFSNLQIMKDLYEEKQNDLQPSEKKASSVWEELPDYPEKPNFTSQYRNKPQMQFLGEGVKTIVSKFDESSKKSENLSFSNVIFRMAGDSYRNEQFSSNEDAKERSSFQEPQNDFQFSLKGQSLTASDRGQLNFKKNNKFTDVIKEQTELEIEEKIVPDSEEFCKKKTQDLSTSTIQPTYYIEQYNEINDPFEKINYLGVGRFASVYLYRIPAINFLFAMKEILHFTLEFNNLEQQFLEEIRLQYQLTHPNILSLYNVYCDKKKVYVALEYGEETLLKKMEAQNEKKLEQSHCLEYIRQIAHGLKYMHERKVIHRDIKPENIILVNGICKIGDFGWAVQKDGQLDQACGTPCYASPQIDKGQPYTTKADCWSLGVLAYQIAFGKLNDEYFDGKQFRFKDLELEGKISKEYEEILRGLLQVEEENRLSIQELLNLEGLTEQ